MVLELPPEALRGHLETLVPRPLDFNDRPARGANESDAPRRERDAVRGEIDASRSEISVEEVLEACTGLHEVEKVTEGLRLAEVQLGLVCPDVIVHLECDEVVQHGGLATSVQRSARAS